LDSMCISNSSPVHNLPSFFFFLPLPPRSTLFPYTTLFRSVLVADNQVDVLRLLSQSGAEVSQEPERTDRPLERDPRGKHRRKQRSEEHTSELQSLTNLVCRLLLEKKKTKSKCSTCAERLPR